MSEIFFTRTKRRGNERPLDPDTYHFAPELCFIDMCIPFNLARQILKYGNAYGKTPYEIVIESLEEKVKGIKT